jgi:polysaccharide export outer membrane protein
MEMRPFLLAAAAALAAFGSALPLVALAQDKEGAGDLVKDAAQSPQPEKQPEKAPDPTVRDLGAYKLRVGDVVQIVVYNGNSLDVMLKAEKIAVPGNGEVSFPPVGKVRLLDRTVFEVETAIAQKLKDENFLATPNVGCVITEYEPRPVFLIGAAQGQIFLPVHRNMRILEVLAKAGTLGFEGADFSNVRIRRVGADGDVFQFQINVDDILQRNDEKQNVVVFETDIIIVPKLELVTPQSAEWVYVLGKVRTPGRQPVLKGRTPFTITKLISMCGDFQEFADRTKIKVIRSTPTGRQPIMVDFDDIIEGERPDVELKPDDLVYVPESWI